MKTGEILFGPTDTDYPVFKIFFSRTDPEQRKHRIEHHHSEFEISLIVSGECQWCVNEESYHGKQGDLYLFGSNENHYLTEIFGTEPLVLLNIRFESRFIWSPGSDRFNLRYLEIFLNHAHTRSSKIPCTEAVSHTVSDLMTEIYTECQEQEPEYKLVVKAKLMLILAALGRYYGIASLPKNTTSNYHLKQLDSAVSYINLHLTDELDLETIAREAGMSKSYFSTIFKKMNGIPVWDYITRKRVELSMQFLRESDLPVTEIAENCGFSSISNFNRCFRHVTGISPRTYRKDFSTDGVI